MEKQKEYRMYENPIMEALSTSGPKMMIAFHLLIVGGLFSYTMINEKLTLIQWLTSFFAGIVFWTFGEYVLHRWVFHFVNEWKWVKHVHRAVHGYHHDYPRDDKRLFMPPVPALILLTVFFGMFYLVMGNFAWGFLPGFEIGYLIYSLIHYSIHTRTAPKLMKGLWVHHSLHHYQYPDLAFGVSNTFWDKVFGTMPPKKDVVEVE